MLTPFMAVVLLAACTSRPSEVAGPPTMGSSKGCGPTLVHDRDWYASGKSQVLFDAMDQLHYPISMDPALPPARRDSIQRYFDQGLLLAYGFNHAEAARSFWQITRMDSTCAMAWWGFAYVLGPNYNAGMEPDNYERARAAAAKAKALMQRCTAKEQDLISAMATRYATPTNDRAALDLAYCEAMRTVAARYPDDADIATLFAESLMDLHPWDLFTKDGEAKEWTPEIIATLERGMQRFPEHPGAHHLYIHAVEASRTPERGLTSARFFTDAVPMLGHLVHMPSHIYIRTGHYHDGVLANRRSVSVDSGYTASSHAQGAYPIVYFPHNIHFLSACAVMSGERSQAWRSALHLREQLARDLMHLPDFATLQHYHAYAWQVAIKQGQWAELEAEAYPDSTQSYARTLWHYAQGMRKVRNGDAEGGRRELEALQMGMADSSLSKLTIWGINPLSGVLTVAQHLLHGEVLAAEGDLAAGSAELEKAVAAEDALQYQEPPDWSFPVRHDLGAMLLKADRAQEAEAVYRQDLMYWPENGFALEGLRDALRAQGKQQEADALAERITKAWAYADERPEAVRASLH
jgi:tetratricopeptide (TPR) repeat protein